MEPISTSLLLLSAGSAIANIFVGLNAARQAKRINEETYQNLMRIAQNYEAEMQGNLPPGSVTPVELEEFKRVVNDYIPDIAEYVPEATPQQITEGGVAAEKQAQKEALQQYGRMAQAGYDPIASAQQEAALTAAASQASASRQAALREAAQRGLGGTGLDVLAGMGATEQAAVGGRQAALQAQAEAGQRRMEALSKYGSMAGQMREQGTQTEQANVNIMNAFNERMARNLNQYNQYVAELQNQAQMQNRAEQQRMAEMNVEQRNKLKMFNVQAQRDAEKERREAQERMVTTKYGIQSGLGELGGRMRGQELSSKTAGYGQALDTLGRFGQAGMEAYMYGKGKKDNKV